MFCRHSYEVSLPPFVSKEVKDIAWVEGYERLVHRYSVVCVVHCTKCGKVKESKHTILEEII